MFTFSDLIRAFFGKDTTKEEFVEEKPDINKAEQLLPYTKENKYE
jgi:hypothetical protein